MKKSVITAACSCSCLLSFTVLISFFLSSALLWKMLFNIVQSQFRVHLYQKALTWGCTDHFSNILTSAKKVMFSSLFVRLLVTLRKNFQTDLHEIFTEGWQWASEQRIKFCWRSGSQIWIRIHIVTLVRRALVQVCTVTVVLNSDCQTWPGECPGQPSWQISMSNVILCTSHCSDTHSRLTVLPGPLK